MSESVVPIKVTADTSQATVREEADVDRIAEKLYKLQERNRRAKGGCTTI